MILSKRLIIVGKNDWVELIDFAKDLFKIEENNCRTIYKDSGIKSGRCTGKLACEYFSSYIRNPYKIGLQELFLAVSKRECSIKLDKIYSILGLLPENINKVIIVDYNLNVIIHG